MNEKTNDGFDIIAERIKAGRDFIVKFNDVEGIPEDYETDQYMKKPQPPLAKAPVTDQIIDLPKDFSTLDIDNDFLGIINRRKSHRVYTDEEISLTELAYLLWCTQGVKEVRGKSYATLLSEPCLQAERAIHLSAIWRSAGWKAYRVGCTTIFP